MTTLNEAFDRAVQHYQAGELVPAEQLYTRILQSDPGHADALHMLGLLARRLGRLDQALDCLREAIRLRPDFHWAHNNLANVYRERGQLDEAEASLRRAVRYQPGFAAGHYNLGIVLRQLGRLEEAAASYREALRLEPSYAEAHAALGSLLRQRGDPELARECYHQALRYRPDFLDALDGLGHVCRALGRWDEAVAACQRVVALKPDSAEAHDHLGNTFREARRLDEAADHFRAALRLRPSYVEAHNNLGVVLQEMGRREEAAAAYAMAVRGKPDFVEALCNLGNVVRELGDLDAAEAHLREALRLRLDWEVAHNHLGVLYREQGRLPEAVEAYREALRLQPDFADAFSNLGMCLRDLDRLDEAIDCYAAALRIAPGFPAALNNLAVARLDQRNPREAMACLRAAIATNPNYAEAQNNLAMVGLFLGDFAESWSRYEWRWRTSGFVARDFPQPRWDGAPLDGRTILLHAEQGLGDTLQFIRYAPLVRERGGRVVVECQPSLVALLGEVEGIDVCVPQGSPLPSFDVYAPLLSLPALFGTTLATIPAKVPYLRVDPSRAGRYRAETGELRVGVCWQGSPTHKNDRRRSVPLAQFASLADVAGIALVSLQYGAGLDQLAQCPFPVIKPDIRSDDPADAWSDTAALVSTLDLVVTVDTAVAHLAGAFGVPVWVAIPFAPDWRWLLDRDDSPWYPSMRLFHQPVPGDWRTVFERMGSELRTQRENRR